MTTDDVSARLRLDGVTWSAMVILGNLPSTCIVLVAGTMTPVSDSLRLKNRHQNTFNSNDTMENTPAPVKMHETASKNGSILHVRLCILEIKACNDLNSFPKVLTP